MHDKTRRNRASERGWKEIGSFYATASTLALLPHEANRFASSSAATLRASWGISMQMLKQGFVQILTLSLIVSPLLAACSGSSGGPTGSGGGSSTGSGSGSGS